MSDVTASVRKEIEEIHAFFVKWYAGAVPADAFESAFVTRMDPDMVFVAPGGAVLDCAALTKAVRDGYGTNDDYGIAIRNVTVRRMTDDHILATYEEWQRNATVTATGNNGRFSTVLLTRSEPFRWLHVHETWLPGDVVAASAFDF